MAKIKKIKEGTATVYPATIPQAVIDPTSGKSVRTELNEKEAVANKKQTVTNSATDYPSGAAVTASLALKTNISDLNKVYPLYNYNVRVLADSGNIQDLNKLTELYIKNLQLLDSTVFLWSGIAGMKTRRATASSPMFASKLYNMANKVQLFGSELVTNGTFTTDTTGWTASGGATLSVDTARLKVTNTAGTNGGATQAITTVVGKTYHLTYSFTLGAGNGQVRVGTTLGGSQLLLSPVLSANTTRTESFVATGTTTYLFFGCDSLVSTDFAIYDTISVKQMDWIEGVNDAAQTTEANQPYVGGVIAPNEVMRLKGLKDDNLLGHQPIFFAQNESVTITTILKPNYQTVGTNTYKGRYTQGTFELFLDNTGNISAYNTITGFISWNLPEKYQSKSIIVTIIINTTSAICYVNGNRIGISSGTYTPLSFNISGLFYTGNNDTFVGDIYFHGIWNKALSASEIQSQYKFLRSFIPEIEGIGIGSQYWATSNYEAVVAGDGSVIQEVQDPAVWATSTTIYNDTVGSELVKLKAAAMWCHYNNDVNNGAWAGKLYNWYAVKLISLYPPTGWRVPTSADFLQLQAYLGGSAVAGGKMKVEGLTYWNSPNTGATNESGFSGIGGGRRTNAGVFNSLLASTKFRTSTASNNNFILAANGANFDLSPDSASEMWGYSLRLLRNSPVGDNEELIRSTLINTDIASTPNSTQFKFGYRVSTVRVKTTANLTNIKVELWNNFYSGTPTLVATLITGKTANNTTMVFPVLADAPALLQDGTLRITATGANTFETIVEYNLQKNTF